jgi:hypothetical protein
MKESTVRILLAEYDRLKALEQARIKSFDYATQLYLTVISAGAGILILLLDRQAISGSLPLYLVLLFGFVLLVGEITFLRLIGIDISLTESAEAYLLIRNKFIKADSNLADAFLKGLRADKEKYLSWSSFRGIIRRVVTVSQQKTMVVSLNCVVFSGLAIVVVWPQSVWNALAVGVSLAILAGALHVIYASWRYKYAQNRLSRGETSFWI